MRNLSEEEKVEVQRKITEQHQQRTEQQRKPRIPRQFFSFVAILIAIVVVFRLLTMSNLPRAVLGFLILLEICLLVTLIAMLIPRKKCRKCGVELEETGRVWSEDKKSETIGPEIQAYPTLSRG